MPDLHSDEQGIVSKDKTDQPGNIQWVLIHSMFPVDQVCFSHHKFVY